MPQTREHVVLAWQVWVHQIVVALNMVDTADDLELLALVGLEVRYSVRVLNWPFLLSIESVLTITGHGTAVTGEVDRSVAWVVGSRSSGSDPPARRDQRRVD
jgi:translation elongation factor EF-Tu-like GTPase